MNRSGAGHSGMAASSSRAARSSIDETVLREICEPISASVAEEFKFATEQQKAQTRRKWADSCSALMQQCYREDLHEDLQVGRFAFAEFDEALGACAAQLYDDTCRANTRTSRRENAKLHATVQRTEQAEKSDRQAEAVKKETEARKQHILHQKVKIAELMRTQHQLSESKPKRLKRIEETSARHAQLLSDLDAVQTQQRDSEAGGPLALQCRAIKKAGMQFKQLLETLEWDRKFVCEMVACAETGEEALFHTYFNSLRNQIETCEVIFSAYIAQVQRGELRFDPEYLARLCRPVERPTLENIHRILAERAERDRALAELEAAAADDNDNDSSLTTSNISPRISVPPGFAFSDVAQPSLVNEFSHSNEHFGFNSDEIPGPSRMADQPSYHPRIIDMFDLDYPERAASSLSTSDAENVSTIPHVLQSSSVADAQSSLVHTMDHFPVLQQSRFAAPGLCNPRFHRPLAPTSLRHPINIRPRFGFGVQTAAMSLPRGGAIRCVQPSIRPLPPSVGTAPSIEVVPHTSFSQRADGAVPQVSTPAASVSRESPSRRSSGRRSRNSGGAERPRTPWSEHSDGSLKDIHPAERIIAKLKREFPRLDPSAIETEVHSYWHCENDWNLMSTRRKNHLHIMRQRCERGLNSDPAGEGNAETTVTDQAQAPVTGQADGEQTCSICLEDLHCNPPTRIFTSPCDGKHRFHLSCIDEWWRYSKDKACPICRQAIRCRPR